MNKKIEKLEILDTPSIKPASVWPFEAAPKPYQEYSPFDGGEEWIVLFDPAMAKHTMAGVMLKQLAGKGQVKLVAKSEQGHQLWISAVEDND